MRTRFLKLIYRRQISFLICFFFSITGEFSPRSVTSMNYPIQANSSRPASVCTENLNSRSSANNYLNCKFLESF
jgi:hypothetical protein